MTEKDNVFVRLAISDRQAPIVHGSAFLLFLAIVFLGMWFVPNGFSWNSPDQAAMKELVAREGIVLHEESAHLNERAFMICDNHGRIGKLVVSPFRGKIYLRSKEIWPGVTCNIEDR